MSYETDNTSDDQLLPSSSNSRDDEPHTPSLGRYYVEAERQLGPEAHHFDVVRRALDLWDEDAKGHERPHHPPPGKDAQ